MRSARGSGMRGTTTPACEMKLALGLDHEGPRTWSRWSPLVNFIRIHKTQRTPAHDRGGALR
jgi:hypothetical protein